MTLVSACNDVCSVLLQYKQAIINCKAAQAEAAQAIWRAK